MCHVLPLPVHLMLCSLLYMNHLNRIADAEAELRLALVHKPNYVSAMCNLALLLSTYHNKV